MSGIIRAGSGEIALRDVPGITPPQLIGRRGEAAAREHERSFPGVVVVCDWEILSDADIATLSPSMCALALQDRAALERRREIAAARPPADVPLRSGDPDRTREVLRRARVDMSLLDVTHPDYIRLFTDLANQINLLEDACDEPRTTFVIADKAAPKPKGPTESEKSIIAGMAIAYRAQGIADRKAAVEKMDDPNLLRAILETEDEEQIRDLIVRRLFLLGAT